MPRCRPTVHGPARRSFEKSPPIRHSSRRITIQIEKGLTTLSSFWVITPQCNHRYTFSRAGKDFLCRTPAAPYSTEASQPKRSWGILDAVAIDVAEWVPTGSCSGEKREPDDLNGVVAESGTLIGTRTGGKKLAHPRRHCSELHENHR